MAGWHEAMVGRGHGHEAVEADGRGGRQSNAMVGTSSLCDRLLCSEGATCTVRSGTVRYLYI